MRNESHKYSEAPVYKRVPTHLHALGSSVSLIFASFGITRHSLKMHPHQIVMKLALLLALLAHLSFAAQAVPLNAASVAALKGFTDVCCKNAVSQVCTALAKAVNPARKASEDLCSLYSNWCDAQGNIRAVVFFPNELKCAFPAKELSAMTSLEIVDLTGNKLNGDLRDVAAMFDKLPNLKAFYGESTGLTGSLSCSLVKRGMISLLLDKNSISGQLPACFLSSPTLQYLSLDENKLSGPLPIPAPGIPLIQLGLFVNSFSGTIPREFARMTKLDFLRLAVNQLTGTIPDLPTSLTTLWLYYNKLSGPITSLVKLTNIQYLLIGDNSLSGPIPAGVLNPNILEFGAIGNQLTGRIDNLPWGNLKRAYLVGLAENKLTGPVPASIAAMANLTALGLRDNSLSGTLDAFAAALPTGNRLKSVTLSGNRLTGTVPQGLQKLKTYTANLCDPDDGECNNPILSLEGNPLTGDFPAWLSAALKPTASQQLKRVSLPTTLQCSTATLDAAVQKKYNFLCMQNGRQVPVPVTSAPAGRRMLS